MAPVRTNDQSCTGATESWSPRKSQAKFNPCPLCGKVIGRRFDMQRHMATHTPKAMRCTFSTDCSYIGRSESSLKTHIRRHTQEKPHVCEDDVENCQYSSIDAAGLLRHRVTHHGYLPRKIHRTKTRANRVPVSVMSQMRNNGDESAVENFRVFRAGKKAGNSDREFYQLDSSYESKAPSFYSDYAYAAPSSFSDNDSTPYYMSSQGKVYLPQVYEETKPELSVLDAALLNYPCSNQSTVVPPFSNAYPANQYMLNFQGWNAGPKVNLEVIEQKKFDIPGQGPQELYTFSAQDEGNYMQAGPSNTVQFDVVAPQPAPGFAEYLPNPTNEFGSVDFSTIANQYYFETQPVEGLQSMSVDAVSHDWNFNNTDVYPSMVPNNFGNPVNLGLPSNTINDDTPSFGQVFDFDNYFSGDAALDNFNFSGNYTNTYQNNIQSY